MSGQGIAPSSSFSRGLMGRSSYSVSSARSLYGSDLSVGYIRLLILHPVLARSTEIKCTLKDFAMDKAPEWEALSYAWGEAECDRRITVNGREIFVRQNVLRALWHLRSENDRVLWVDALSINQGNIAERNHQVMQMSRIYRNSWRVLVWLGVENDKSDEALKCIASVNYRKNGTLWCHHHNEEFRPDQLGPIRRLFEREYWSRLWIVQECLVAKDAFKLAVHHTIFDLQKAPLRALLSAFSSSECADVRDKIYGLVGLAKDGGDLEIDYSKTVSEVFVDVIMLQKYDDCRVLVSYSQFLQQTFKGEVDTPLPVFGYSPAPYVGALGYNIGTVSKLETVEFDTSLTPGQLETTKKAISGRVMPISSKFSCGVKGGVETYDDGDEESCMFFDDSGRAGLAPMNTKLTDVVCAFDNCDVIAILRRNGDRYSVVGRAVIFTDDGQFEIETSSLIGTTEFVVREQWRVPKREKLSPDKAISLALDMGTLQLLTR
ncbi:hypothetical protein IFR05_014579 [Cadophora sp. M221]|nr:hypothetical protein IFR05_014579 [Cadophora sp. M221]